MFYLAQPGGLWLTRGYFYFRRKSVSACFAEVSSGNLRRCPSQFSLRHWMVTVHGIVLVLLYCNYLCTHDSTEQPRKMVFIKAWKILIFVFFVNTFLLSVICLKLLKVSIAKPFLHLMSQSEPTYCWSMLNELSG